MAGPRPTWLVAATVLALVAGCAGASKKATTPHVAMTAERAQSIAAAGVLTEADLPGFQAKKQTHTTQDDANEALLTSCLGFGKVTYLARDFGMAFSKGSLEVDSSVDVATSVADARKHYAAMTTPKALDCASRQGRQVITAGGLTVDSLTLTRVDVGLAGVRTFGYQIRVKGSTQGRSFTISGYQLGALAAGQVEVALDAIDFAGSPSLPQLVDLLSRATERATAAAS